MWSRGCTWSARCALDDWTPHSDIDVVAVVADPSDPDLFGDLAAAQAFRFAGRCRSRSTARTSAWGDLVVPPMAVYRPWVLDGEYHVDGESFEINPVVWYTLATYGLALRGDAVDRLGVHLDCGERRRWVRENLQTYWRGVGERLASQRSRGTRPARPPTAPCWNGWPSESPGCSTRGKPVTSCPSPLPARGPRPGPGLRGDAACRRRPSRASLAGHS